MTVDNYLQEAGALATLSGILAGIGLAGWIRSRAAGIVTSIIAVITMCLTTWVIFSAIAVFM